MTINFNDAVIHYLVYALAWIILFNRGRVSGLFDHIRTPSNGGFELNWGLRQVLRWFSVAASERWYEARTHTDQGVLVSLCCVFGLVQIVRFEYTFADDDCRLWCPIKRYWFKTYSSLISNKMGFLKDELKKYRLEAPVPVDSHQIFVAGHNVTWDFMNGWLI